MRTVHKFPLPPARIGEAHTVQMPEGAQILRLAVQDGFATIWALVDTEKPMETRQFQVVATGQALDFTGPYIGTGEQGALVWHIFEPQVRAWIPWEGGECPVLGFVNVDYRLRDGRTCTAPAGGLEWAHTPCGPNADPDDIVAYRESDEQPDR